VKAQKESKESAFLTYSLVIGSMLWSFLRKSPARDLSRRSSPEFSAPKRSQSDSLDRPLENLSETSDGDVALDHLFHIAAKEESGSEAANLQVVGERPAAAQASILDTEDEVLKRQSLTSKLLPGWHLPAPEGLPVPTFAPAIMAMGIVFFVMGIVTTWYVCVAGIIVFAVATWLWLAELQGD
jgi:hypothetical protein